jgi:pimeloyl-ACP methyl ester carboxylesterase
MRPADEVLIEKVPRHRRFVRIVMLTVAIGLAVFALALIAGLSYEQIAEARDRASLPRVGRSVSVGNGRTMNIFCSGTGSPTVVLESGHSVPGIGWSVIQPQIAAFTRACWYDRAGYGWSDPGSFPQRSDEIAEELHTLLANSGEQGPYVLVGHLFGTFNVRAYQHLYPREVAGLVLIDPVSEAPGNPTMPPKQHVEAVRPGMLILARTLAQLGVFRLLTKNFYPTPPEGFSQETWHTIWELTLRPKTIVARMSETPLWASALHVAGTRVGDIPLLVLSPATADPAKLHAQSALASLSTQGVHRILPPVSAPMFYENSGDMVPYESPQLVTQAIHQIVLQIRG